MDDAHSRHDAGSLLLVEIAVLHQRIEEVVLYASVVVEADKGDVSEEIGDASLSCDAFLHAPEQLPQPMRLVARDARDGGMI